MDNSGLPQTCYAALSGAWELETNAYRKKILTLGVIVAATTTNDTDVLDQWFPKCEAVINQEVIEEAILQTLLFAGFPKTIEALKVMRNHYPQSSASKHVEDHAGSGEITSKVIYGKHHTRLKEVMDELHPDLTRWMIADGYGRVLSRPGLSLADREILVVASLMASGMLNQYRAHIRGVLLAGVAKDDIVWFTDKFKCVIPANLHEPFEKVTTKTLENFVNQWG